MGPRLAVLRFAWPFVLSASYPSCEVVRISLGQPSARERETPSCAFQLYTIHELCHAAEACGVAVSNLSAPSWCQQRYVHEFVRTKCRVLD